MGLSEDIKDEVDTKAYKTVDESKTNKQKQSKSDRVLNSLLVVLTIALLLMTGSRFFVFPAVIEGRSMETTLQPDERVWVTSKSFSTYKHGSIILFNNPFGEKTDAWYNIGELTNFEEPVRYIKRIIGVPGDTVQYSMDNVTLNGVVYYERGYATLEGKDIHEVTLAEGEYFVMGDNHDFSLDSRSFGPIKEESIIGTMKQTEEEIKDYFMNHYYTQSERVEDFRKQLEEERDFTQG